jgi:hypothetical protein
MPVGIDDLIISLEVDEEQAVRNGERALTEIRNVIASARADGRANLTPSEEEDVDRCQRAAAKSKTDLQGIRNNLSIAKKTKAAEMEASEHLLERGPGGAQPLAERNQNRGYDKQARIGQEERTYHRGNTGDGGAFLQDVAKQFLFRDIEAEQRLARHMQEERVERGQYMQRAAGTGAFAGLVVPQYLTEMYAPALANMSPFADICNTHDLPETGMTVNISRITTPTSVALQATENTSVSNTDIDDTLLTENVQTAAGQQTLSRQAIERGTGVEGVVVSDLFRRYATTKDSTLINQASTGLDAIADVTNAYTDASPTAAELWPKLLGAAAGVETNLLGLGSAKVALMHPRRWYWLQSQLTTSFPFISQPGIPGNASGTNNGAAYGTGFRGILPSGLAVVTDANIATNKGAGTNEDRIYIVDTDECHLWEDANAPVFIRAEQAAAASLGVLLVLYGYFAYSFRRFTNSVQAISGTGMITPTF